MDAWGSMSLVEQRKPHSFSQDKIAEASRITARIRMPHLSFKGLRKELLVRASKRIINQRPLSEGHTLSHGDQNGFRVSKCRRAGARDDDYDSSAGARRCRIRRPRISQHAFCGLCTFPDLCRRFRVGRAVDDGRADSRDADSSITRQLPGQLPLPLQHDAQWPPMRWQQRIQQAGRSRAAMLPAGRPPKYGGRLPRSHGQPLSALPHLLDGSNDLNPKHPAFLRALV